MNQASATEVLMREHAQSNMAAADYHAMMAGWVADNTGQYSPRLYPGASEAIKKYCRERCMELIERDSIYHRQVGIWTLGILKLREQNDSDLSLLLWCKEKIKGKAMGTADQTLTRQADKFASLQFPYESFGLAMRAQAKDMGAKPGEERIRR